MAQTPPRDSRTLLRAPFAASLALLAPHLSPPDSTSTRHSRLDQAIASTHEWCTKLLELDTAPGVETVDAFCSFLSRAFFDYKVDSAAQFSTSTAAAAASTAAANRDATSPHGPRPRTLDGNKVAAMVHVLKELVTGLNDRASASAGNGEWWFRVGIALGDGLSLHLDENDVGKKTTQDLAYRTYLCSVIAEPLVRMVVPDPNELPKSSADDLGGLGKNPEEMAAKYSALDVLGNLLSKNEQNKTLVARLFPPEYLGAILHAGFDHHLSHLTFELAFRLLPTSRSPDARKAFLAQLFSDDVFGKGKEELAKSLRKRMDKLDVSTAWEEGYRRILKRISEMHIRRSQFFEAVSIEYDSKQLLAPSERGEASFNPRHTPSLAEIVDEKYYEPELLWISRHILAATTVVIEDGSDGPEESTERMVVPLAGVAKVFVVDLDKELEHEATLGCLRITFLIDPSTPLTMSSKPYPSQPSHLGSTLRGGSETQGLEFEAAGTELDKYHELVVLVKRNDGILKVLAETLWNRGKQYPRLVDELSDFPKYSARTRPTITAKTPAITKASTSEAVRPPAAHVANGQLGDLERRVTFAASPDLARTADKQKSSEGAEGLASPFSEERPKGGGEEAEDLGERGKKGGEEEEDGDDGPSKLGSQGDLRKRRDELASITEIEGEGASQIGDSIKHDAEGVGQKQSREVPFETGAQELSQGSIDMVGGGSDTPSVEIQPERSDVTETLYVREKRGADKGQKETAAGDVSSELSEAISDPISESASGEKEGAQAEKGEAVERREDSIRPDDQELPPPPKKVVASYSSRRRPGTTEKDAKKVVDKSVTPFKSDREEREDKESDATKSKRSYRQRGARSPAGPKTVVAARHSTEVKKTVANQPKGRKRGRSSSSKEQDEIEAAESSGNDDAEATSSSDDLAHPDEIGQGKPTAKRKKVAKSTSKAKPAPKRRKVSTDADEETDYEVYPSLEKKRVGPLAAKKYGKEQKHTVTRLVGATKKAGKKPNRKDAARDHAPHQQEDGEEEENRDEKEGRAAKTTSKKRRTPRPRRAAATKKKGGTMAEQSSDVAGEEEGEVEEDGPGKVGRTSRANSAAPKVGGKPEQGGSGKASPSSMVARSPAKRSRREKRKELTPPPFEVSVPTLGQMKHAAPPSVSETTSNQPRKTFAELVREHPVPTTISDEHIAREEEEDLGGFNQDISAGEEVAGFAQDELATRPRATEPAGNTPSYSREAAGSLSPLPHPATTDFSFADQAFAEGSAIGDHAEAHYPRILVEDTPAPSVEQVAAVAKDGGTYLGNHTITSQRAQTESQEEDVEMGDGGELEGQNEIHDRGAGEQEDAEGEVENDEYEGVGLADDSGLHFDLPIDKGIGGRDEASFVSGKGEAGMLSRAQQSLGSQQHRSAIPPARTRPLLVPRVVDDRFRPQDPRPRPRPRPDSSTVTPNAPITRGQPRSPVRSRRHISATDSSRQNAATVAQPAHHLPRPTAAPTPTILKRARASPSQLQESVRSATRPRQSNQKQAQRKTQGFSASEGKGIGNRAPSRASRPTLRFEDEQLDAVELEDDDFDEDDLELYESLLDFADIMTCKNRERRRARQDHHAQSKIRFEEPLIQFMNSVFDETNDMLNSVRTLSTEPFDATSPDTSTAAERILASASTAAAQNDALWSELQRQLLGFEASETSRGVDGISVGENGGGAVGSGV